MNIQMSNDISHNRAAIYPDLKDKTFLVTGASSGIGQAVAIALSQQGSNVVITGRNKERLQETASQIKTKVTLVTCDLTDTEQRNDLVESMPMLDGICHAAGIINPFPIRLLDENQFNKVFNINAKAPILLTAKLLRKKKLNDNSSIVFISSISSQRAMKGGALYSSSKAAVEAFSRTVTLEHTNKGIRSNSIKPGLIKTPILDQAASLLQAANSEKVASIPPVGELPDVVNSILFLLSDVSRWVVATELTTDNGFSVEI